MAKRNKIAPRDQMRIRRNVLRRIESGESFIDSCQKSGVSETTVRNWGRRDAKFKAQLDEAKKQGRPLRARTGWRAYNRLV